MELQTIKTNLAGLVPSVRNTPIVSSFERTLQPVTDFIRGNPIVSTAALGIGTTGLVAAVASVKSRKKSTSTKKRRKTSSKKRKTKKRSTTRRKTKKRGRRTPHTAGKGRDRSTRRIRYTKKGQPYVITRSGKAKFIKKSSAKRSHKRKGGRY